MASKVVVALFINTCLLVYIIDILINKNIIGAGGSLFNYLYIIRFYRSRNLSIYNECHCHCSCMDY
jgi:hypothetical protein